MGIEKNPSGAKELKKECGRIFIKGDVPY